MTEVNKTLQQFKERHKGPIENKEEILKLTTGDEARKRQFLVNAGLDHTLKVLDEEIKKKRAMELFTQRYGELSLFSRAELKELCCKHGLVAGRGRSYKNLLPSDAVNKMIAYSDAHLNGAPITRESLIIVGKKDSFEYNNKPVVNIMVFHVVNVEGYDCYHLLHQWGNPIEPFDTFLNSFIATKKAMKRTKIAFGLLLIVLSLLSLFVISNLWAILPFICFFVSGVFLIAIMNNNDTANEENWTLDYLG